MKHILLAIIGIYLTSCAGKQAVDLIVHNGTIYTVDSAFSTVEAMVVKDGKIIATGKSADILNTYEAKEKIDAQGKFVYPGFIDAHSHFFRYGIGLQTADLTGTESWEAILEKLKIFAANHTDGWLIGRGWDQNDWPVKE